jgi:hypothetical protein
MTKTAWLAMAAALCASAQSNRDAYRDAYRVWRETDPTIEQDAVAGTAALTPRTERAAEKAAKYGAARLAFLQQLDTENSAALSSLENAAPGDPASVTPLSIGQLLSLETDATAHYVEIFAKDQDPGIQQLRQAHEQEHSALVALTGAVEERAKATAASQAAAGAVEQALLKVIEQNRQLMDSLKQTAEQTNAATAAWAEYYQKLAEAPQSSAKTESTGVNVARPANPAPRPAAPSVTPVPLVRYTGAWTYPETNRLFHGAEPQVIDLTVNEESGKASGTLVARFKLAPGSSGDPVLRFEFSGEFKSTRNQVFPLITSDGAKGTIELIPGPAFNLLEVNFQTEPRPGKVQQGNVMLVKQ